MPSVFCQFSMSESMPAVRIRSMSEQVRTGRSHDLQQCNVRKLATGALNGDREKAEMPVKHCVRSLAGVSTGKSKAHRPFKGTERTPQMVEASHRQVWWRLPDAGQVLRGLQLSLTSQEIYRASMHRLTASTMSDCIMQAYSENVAHQSGPENLDLAPEDCKHQEEERPSTDG